MKKSIFYHVGCRDCSNVERDIVKNFGAKNIEIVNLGKHRSRITEAEEAGVKSLPVLVEPNGNVVHIDSGLSLQDIKF